MKHLTFLGINGETRWRDHCLCRLCAYLLVGLFIAGCGGVTREIVYRPTPESVPKISNLEARETIKQLLQNKAYMIYAESKDKHHSEKDGVKFKKAAIECTSNYNGKNYIWSWVFLPKSDIYVNQFGEKSFEVGMEGSSMQGGNPRFDNISDATAFANAVYVYKNTEDTAYLAAESAFANSAKKYRAMPVKPPLPEDARRLKVMAEDAFQNKEFEKAADYYEQALEIEPLWPEGQYNAANLYGEIKDYESATFHMKRYLELVPDAKDAEEARDQMYLWEGKAKEAGK